MPARMTRSHKRAHTYLSDWASYQINNLNSSEIGFKITQYSVRVQIQAKSICPSMAMTPPRVRLIDNWYEDASPTLRRHAFEHYINDKKLAIKLTSRQYYYLLDRVGKYLTNRVTSA